MNCCICGKTIENHGNDPSPYIRVENAKCCDNCNTVHVIPLRLKLRNRDYDSYIENGLNPTWKECLRYKNFTEINPTPFNVLFKDKNYDTVLLHSIEPLNDLSDIVGFVGSVSWWKNKLRSLDGDTYYPEMLIYGYKETDETVYVYGHKETNKVLDILVKDW